MAESVGAIFYTVDMQTQPLIDKAQQAQRAMDELGATMKQTDSAATVAERGINRVRDANGRFVNSSSQTQVASLKLQNGLSGVGGAANGAADGAGELAWKMGWAKREGDNLLSGMTELSKAISAAISVRTLVSLQQTSEQFTVLSARVTRLSLDAAAGAENFRQLMAISSQTGASLKDTVSLWESLTSTLRELGKTNTQILGLTSTLQKIGTIGGSSSTEMANALRQLGQGLAGGTLRAEEFNSVLEGMPELARQIAAGMGMSMGQLRQAMLDGKLTAEAVLTAIQSRAESVNAEFDKIPRTASAAATGLSNAFGQALSKLDETLGITKAIVERLDAMAMGVKGLAGTATDVDKLNAATQEQNRLLDEQKKMQDSIFNNPARSAEIKARLSELATIKAVVQARIDAAAAKRAEAEADAAAKSKAPPSNSTPEGKKALDELTQQATAAALSGKARAEYLAVQKLGEKATEVEKKQAVELAGKIYDLEQAKKSETEATRIRTSEAKKAASEAKKAAEEEQAARDSNVESLAKLTEGLYAASLPARELAQRQAELSLNEYATPAQIAQARELAGAIYDAAEAKRKAAAFGTDVAGTIRGTVTPLSGGAFDNQSARYAAEAQAEQDRYAQQMARLQEAKALQLQVVGGYQALEQQMAQEHADRLQQIEDAKNSVLLSSAASTFESLAGLSAQFAGKQSALFAVMFAASKAFAIAESVIKIQQGIAAAAALPFPANLPAMATVAAATGSIVSTIAGTTMGRMYGGPVDAGNLYRINESGAPEVFNAANGRQYMLPNQRGEVVSNADATGAAGGGGVTIHVHNNAAGVQATASSQQMDGKTVVDIVVSSITGDGPVGKAIGQTFGMRRAGR